MTAGAALLLAVILGPRAEAAAGAAATDFGVGGGASVTNANGDGASAFVVAYRAWDDLVAVEVTLCAQIAPNLAASCKTHAHKGEGELYTDSSQNPRLTIDVPELGLVDLTFESAGVTLARAQCIDGEPASFFAVESPDGVVDGHVESGGIGVWTIEQGRCALWASPAAMQWVTP